MKIVITEDQFKTLQESDRDFKKTKSLVVSMYNNTKDIEEIKVIGTSKGQVMDYSIKNKIDVIYITINFYIDSIYEYNNLDNFIYELQEEARSVVGGKFITINYGEVINKRKNFDW